MTWYGMTIVFAIRYINKYRGLGQVLARIAPPYNTDNENVDKVHLIASGCAPGFSERDREIAIKLLEYWIEKGRPGKISNKQNIYVP
jgi:hypothetical protein